MTGVKKMGRPTDFTPELADFICEQIADGLSLRAVCRLENMPHVITVIKWRSRFPDFDKQYDDACLARTEAMAEDIIAISDDGENDTYLDEDGNERVRTDVIARSKLRVDTRKWIMARMKPKKYGDRVAVTDPDGGPLQVIIARNGTDSSSE